MTFKIVVAGGCGFMGSDFANTVALKYPHWEVQVLDALTYAANPGLLMDAPNLTFTRGDIRNRADVAGVATGADVIINFAAQTHNDRSLVHPSDFTTTNIVGTEVLLEAAHRQGAHFHQVSTDEVYGDAGTHGGVVFTPHSPLRPSSPYSASKASADLLVMAWQRSFGLRASISRSTNNYGPGQHPEKFLPRQIIRALHGQPLVVYGDGSQRRDWLYVSDHTAAVLTILEHELHSAGPHHPTPSEASVAPSSAWHIGSGTLSSNIDIATQIATAYQVDIQHVADRPGHDHSYELSTENTAALGWEPQVRLTEGLARTQRWYEENEPLWREAFAASEQFYGAIGSPEQPEL